MQSAPRHTAETKLITLPPAFADPTRSPRSTVRSITASIPSRSASTAGSSAPAFATTRSSSNTTLVASGRAFTMRVTPWRRTRSRWHGPSCLHQGVIQTTTPDNPTPKRWIQAKAGPVQRALSQESADWSNRQTESAPSRTQLLCRSAVGRAKTANVVRRRARLTGWFHARRRVASGSDTGDIRARKG
jgi:hypothetical protein